MKKAVEELGVFLGKRWNSGRANGFAKKGRKGKKKAGPKAHACLRKGS